MFSQIQSVFTNSATLPDVHAVEKQDLAVTKEGVLGLLKSLKSGKAPGPDGLNKQKLCITPILACIYNYSLKTGILPLEWKLAYVTYF